MRIVSWCLVVVCCASAARAQSLFAEEDYLPGAYAGQQFGRAPSLDGDELIIGALDYPYVYERSGSTWTLAQTLVSSDWHSGDNFGLASALEGTTLLIGAPTDNHSGFGHAGSAYEFKRVGSTWVEQAKIVSPTPHGGAQFGMFLSLSGDTVAIAAYGEDVNGPGGGSDHGAVYVFRRSGSSWNFEARLVPAVPLVVGHYGCGLSLDGDTLAIGGYYNGIADVYVRSGSNWTLQQQITPSVPASQFGTTLALDGDTLLVGAPYTNAGLPYQGVAFVYHRSGAVWTQQALLTASDEQAEGLFGTAVELQGDRAAISALGQLAPAPSKGALYLFRRTGTSWSEDLEIVGTTAAPLERLELGPLDGDTLVGRCPMATLNGGTYTGEVHVFRFVDAPETYCTSGPTSSGCTPHVSATGTPSASGTSSFLLDASGLEGARSARWFYGVGNALSTPWGNSTSYLCVASPLQRTALQSSGGTSGVCDGSASLDWNAWVAANPTALGAPFATGDLVRAQVWFRDPAAGTGPPGAHGTALSDAIEFTHLP